jgi:hypothetical protein
MNFPSLVAYGLTCPKRTCSNDLMGVSYGLLGGTKWVKVEQKWGA